MSFHNQTGADKRLFGYPKITQKSPKKREITQKSPTFRATKVKKVNKKQPHCTGIKPCNSAVFGGEQGIRAFLNRVACHPMRCIRYRLHHHSLQNNSPDCFALRSCLKGSNPYHKKTAIPKRYRSFWRRARDSNPRVGVYPLHDFQSCSFGQLGQLSK